MMELVTGWFRIMQYDNKIAISIANFVENTCVTSYPIPIYIMYDQGSKFIDYEFRKSQIENNTG